jgi:hypothetical protein
MEFTGQKAFYGKELCDLKCPSFESKEKAIEFADMVFSEYDI